MNRCLKCNAHFDTELRSCPNCHYQPQIKNGLISYAPELCHQGGGFKEHYFSDLEALEKNNFWFVSRNKIITWALRKYRSNFNSFLEIGCGTGYVLSGIAEEFLTADLYGSEIFIEGLKFASTRTPNAKFFQMDARNIPFYNEFDVIGIFDVLEHIEEDSTVLSQIFSALKPNGLLFVTVPQHMWLWSTSDDYACHVRRYSSFEIHKKIEDAGFNILRSTSFMSFLLPVMMLSRLFNKKDSEQFDPADELKIPSWMNSLFLKIMTFERILIKRGANFPLGGSRLIIAKKNERNND